MFNDAPDFFVVIVNVKKLIIITKSNNSNDNDNNNNSQTWETEDLKIDYQDKTLKRPCLFRIYSGKLDLAVSYLL